jgi:hypothetical protein
MAMAARLGRTLLRRNKMINVLRTVS